MKRLGFILVILCFFSCEEKTDWTPSGDSKQYVIIDGLLTNEHKTQMIKVSLSGRGLNEPVHPISHASVIVSTQDSSWTFTESVADAGCYLAPSGFSASAGQTYSLLVGVENNVYTAKAQAKNVDAFDFLHYTNSSASSQYYYVSWVCNPYNSVHPAMYEIQLDWSKVPGYEPLPNDSCYAVLYYYSLPSVDVNELFAPEAEQVLFPKGTKIIEKKYSLSDEQAAFYRSLLLETSWKGGYFDVAPANITTNLSGGALGFFGVSQVVADSAFVE